MIANDFDYISLGIRVRECRQAMDMTQAQLAQRTGVTGSFIGHIERGEKKAWLETLVRLAEVLNTGLDYLALGRMMRCTRERCAFYEELAQLMNRYQ